MAGVVGPRLGKHRAPVSLRADEVQAYITMRAAVRQLHEATEAERRAVDENRSATALNMAHARTEACVAAYNKAFESLIATMEEG